MLIPKSIFDKDFGKGNIGWCSDKNIDQLFNLYEGTVFVSNHGSLRYIPLARQTKLELKLVEEPRKAFADVLRDYKPKQDTFIHHTAKIHPSAIIHDGVIIGQNVVIGANTVIGGEGFGYIDNDRIPHRGGVVIGDGVEIGSNTCIDRAVIGDTMIGHDTKIDNLVHIAHGVRIGSDCKIIARAMIAGSCIIGDKVWIAPSASIMNGVKIGNEAVIGMGSVVLKDVPPKTTVAGVPAKPLVR